MSQQKTLGTTNNLKNSSAKNGDQANVLVDSLISEEQNDLDKDPETKKKITSFMKSLRKLWVEKCSVNRRSLNQA